MLASFRAELFVLRKWRVVWTLVAALPVYVFIVYDLGSYVQYLTVSPLEASLSTNLLSSDLATVSPSQFVRVAAVGFGGLGPTAAMILGALVAAGDWERGTINMSLLAGPGRVRTVAGQAAALWAVVAAGIVGTFVMAAGCSLIIWSFGSGPFPQGAGAMPPVGTVAHALGATVLVGAAYGTAGLALGTVVRSVGGAVVACLVWAEVVETTMGTLGYGFRGVFELLYDHLPLASAETLSLMFGMPGGGGALLEVSPTSAVWILLEYTAVFLSFTIVLRLRDVNAGGTSRSLWRPRSRVRPKVQSLCDRRARPKPSTAESKAGGSLSGVVASLRAELFVLARWPAIVALVIGPSFYTLLHNYVLPYELSRSAASSAAAGQLPAFLPGQFVAGFLNSFSPGNIFDFAPFLLIGAWVAGSSWADGTFKTALLQQPGRTQTSIAQALAVGITVATGPVLTFVLSGAASEVIALTHPTAVPPPSSSFPPVPQLAGALGTAVVIALAYAAIGWTLGTLFRSPGPAMAVVLLWSLAVQPTLMDQLAPSFHGVALAVYDILPGAATTSLAYLFGTGGYGYFGAPTPGGPQLATTLSFVVLSLYVILLFAVSASLIRRRNVL